MTTLDDKALVSDEWIGDVFERLQKNVPEKEWKRLEMTLDDKALGAAQFDCHDDYEREFVRAAITAYLAALPIPEGDAGEVVRKLRFIAADVDRLAGPQMLTRAADLIIRLQQVLADPAAFHLHALRHRLLSRENALHLAGATDYDSLKETIIRQQRRIEILTEIGSDQQQEIERLKRASPAATEPAMTPEPTPQSSPDRS